MKTNTNITIGVLLLILVMTGGSVFAQGNEITIPLSNPSERGKLKVDINSGSITVKATSRKDVLVRYREDEDGGEKEAR